MSTINFFDSGFLHSSTTFLVLYFITGSSLHFIYKEIESVTMIKKKNIKVALFLLCLTYSKVESYS